MYDYAHCLEDSIEGITHSLCSIEFEDHRPLYDWFLDQLGIFHPQQIEFARLNLTYTVMSKRVLRRLVESGAVAGWDDPRMPTLSGLRRRGVTPESIRSFISRIGLAKRDSIVDVALLEHCMREDLNMTSRRVMGVLHPLRLVIENYPGDRTEEFDFVVNPEDESAGTRKVPFSRTLYIDRDDFMEDPPGKYHRLAPGREVRLRYAYLVTCTGVVHDENGEVKEVVCTYDPETRGGNPPDGRKVKGTIHWVSAPHSLEAEVRLYDRLFTAENPPFDDTMEEYLNPESLEVLPDCRVESSLSAAVPGDRFQFERKGYFCVDIDSVPGRPVFNLTIPLRDTWAKIRARGSASGAEKRK
jgi:glutaminyl-tRNA synthetase